MLKPDRSSAQTEDSWAEAGSCWLCFGDSALCLRGQLQQSPFCHRHFLIIPACNWGCRHGCLGCCRGQGRAARGVSWEIPWVWSGRGNKSQQVLQKCFDSIQTAFFCWKNVPSEKQKKVLLSLVNTNSSRAPSRLLPRVCVRALPMSSSRDYCANHLCRSDADASKPSLARSSAKRPQPSAWQWYLKEYSWKE